MNFFTDIFQGFWQKNSKDIIQKTDSRKTYVYIIPHWVKDYWIRTEKCSVFVRIKNRIDINRNTILNTDEYGALFSPYSVVFYAVPLCLSVNGLSYLRCIYTLENFPRNGKFSADRMRSTIRKNRTAHAFAENFPFREKFSEVYMHL